MYSVSQYRHEPVSHYGRFGTGLTVAKGSSSNTWAAICSTYFLDKQYRTRSFISISHVITISIDILNSKNGESSRPPQKTGEISGQIATIYMLLLNKQAFAANHNWIHVQPQT